MHLPVHNTRETPFFFRCSFPTQGHRAAGLPSVRQRSVSCQQSPPAPRRLHEPRTKRGGRGAVTAGAPLPAAARLQPPGLPPPQSERDEASPRPFPRAQGPTASRWRRQDPPQPQRPPNGHLTAAARATSAPPAPT